MTRSVFLSVVLVASLLAPSLASAGEVADQDVPTAETEWYGWKIMGTDALSLGVAIGGFALGAQRGPNDNETLMYASLGVGLSAYALVPAYLHHREGRTRAAWISASLRLALPVAGGLIGWATNDLGDRYDDVSVYAPIVGGALIGMAGAMVIDWAFLSHREIAPRREAPSYAFGLAPRAEGGLTLSLGGTF